MISRSKAAELGRDTLAILGQGYYVAPSGGRVDIAAALAAARDGSTLYTPAGFRGVFSGRDEILADRLRVETTFRVVNETTLSAAAGVLAAIPFEDLLCLNFASAKNPGGGFLSGARAQEESLARSSGLYACIAPVREMYDANRACRTCLYTDHMIHSPGVPVFRTDDGGLLDEPYAASFLTAPAVNAGALRAHERRRIEPVMLARIEKLLSVAVVHGHDTLILGAWGCGAFKNNPADVADWFRQHLAPPGLFAGVFREVIFAITDWSPEQRFIGPFRERF